MTAVDRLGAPWPTPTLIAPSAGAGLDRRPTGRGPWGTGRVLAIALVLGGLAVTLLVNPVATLAALGTGFFNTAGGGGAVLTFLTLTAVGVGALTAHATSQLVTPSSFIPVLPLVRKHSPGWRLLVAGCLGTVAGVLVLKHTAPGTVQLLAPFALLLAGGLVLIQGRVQAIIERTGRQLGPRTALVLMLLCGIYAGMIGIGTGTLALVVLGLTPRFAGADLPKVIMARNVLLLGMAAVVSLVFIRTGLVSWPLAAVLALPGAVGGWIGVRLVNRLPVAVLRASIAATAGAGAMWMWLR